MKYLLMTLVSLSFLSGIAWARSNSFDWLSFKHQYNKSYASQAEEARRFANFMATKALVDAHNADPNKSYESGINHMADWDMEERARLLGYRHDPSQVVSELSADDQAYVDAIIGDKEPPDEVDWRKVPGRVSDVKFQGMCDSCWAFATTGVLEGQEIVRNFTEKLIPLSAQNLLDCSKQNHGCKGGIMSKALQDIANLGGIDSDNEYPYLRIEASCRFSKEKSVMTVMKSVVLPEDKEELLKKLVAKFGPVSVSLYVTLNFQSYRRGVLKDKTCPPGKLNHAVLVVGYGKDPKEGDYWLIKNSWGKTWGDSGYIRIERGNNMCGIATAPTIPKF